MDEPPEMPDQNSIDPDDAAYFSRFFGGAGSPEESQLRAESALMTSFANMATIFMVKHFIYTSGSPKEVREELIAMWKQSIWDVHNEDINLHAKKMNTSLGKLFGPMLGDSESMRVIISKRIRNVEKQLRRILTDPRENSEGRLDIPGEYPQS